LQVLLACGWQAFSSCSGSLASISHEESRTEVKLEGDEYLVIRESDLLAVVTNGNK
jgi:hypothetical protein